jgi:hypothetical protein
MLWNAHAVPAGGALKSNEARYIELSSSQASGWPFQFPTIGCVSNVSGANHTGKLFLRKFFTTQLMSFRVAAAADAAHLSLAARQTIAGQ